MNGDGGTINRGPSDVDDCQPIRTGGPPHGPLEDNAVSIALHDLTEQFNDFKKLVADYRLEINELRRRLEALEGE